MFDRSTMQLGMQAAALVSTAMMATAAGALLGFGVDRYAHTSPFGIIIGVFLGFPLGMYRLVTGLRHIGVLESGDDPH